MALGERIEELELDSVLEAMPTDEDAFGLTRKSGGHDLFLNDVVTPTCDTAAVTTDITICTDAIDHEREVIIPEGVIFDAYRANPVVLWDHGRNPMMPFPLGMSETPDGQFAVVATDEAIKATCFWDQQNKAAMQVFGMVCRKALRGASITTVPLKAAKWKDKLGREIRVIEVSQMAEWSWTPVPMNPEAVKKSFANNQRLQGLYLDRIAEQKEAIDEVLRIGRIDGSQIVEPLRKSLELYRPQGSARGIGVSFSDPGEKETMTTNEKKKITADELKAGGKDLVRKSFSELDSFDDESQAIIKKSYGEMEDDDEMEPMSESAMKFGAETLSMLHGIYGAISDEIKSRMKRCENDAVLKAMEADLNTLTEMMTATEGVYSEQYPDAEPLVPDAETEDEMMSKSLAFLHVDTRSKNQLLAVKNRVDRIMKSALGKLDKDHVQLLERTVKDMESLIQKSAGFKVPTQTVEVIKEVVKEVPVEVKQDIAPEAFQAFSDQLEALNAKLSDLLK